MSKKCSKCFQVKPLSGFYRHSRMKDGRLNKCIECTKADATKARLERIEYYREYDRRRASSPNRVAARKAYSKTPEGRAAMARASKRWDVLNAHKKAAATAVNNAVRDGRLEKQPCFVCGSESTEGHHASYDLPLAVTWLCDKHHKQVHKEHRERERMAA